MAHFVNRSFPLFFFEFSLFWEEDQVVESNKDFLIR